ncbi:hypothetical protein AB0H12_27870 [Actinosynnema sp. NPDC023794]
MTKLVKGLVVASAGGLLVVYVAGVIQPYLGLLVTLTCLAVLYLLVLRGPKGLR